MAYGQVAVEKLYWYAVALGLALGYKYYFLAAVAKTFAVGVPRIPHFSKLVKKDEET